MRCPACGCQDDKVVDSRVVKEGAGVRRRRECLTCGQRFTTYEGIIQGELKVLKRNGVLEEFDRDKLRRGIANACYKRPVDDEIIDRVVDDLAISLQKDFDKEVSSGEIGKRAMAALASIDQVAYVRFASVYRKFEAVEHVIDDIRALAQPAEKKKD